MKRVNELRSQHGQSNLIVFPQTLAKNTYLPFNSQLPLPRRLPPTAISTQRRPAINLQHIPRHMRRPSTRQKQDQPPKILRRAHPPTRLPSDQRIQRTLHAKRRHSRGKHSGTNTIHRDMVRHQFARLAFGEMNTCCFGRSVGECSCPWSGESAFFAYGYVDGRDAGHGGDVDHSGWVVGCGRVGEEGV